MEDEIYRLYMEELGRITPCTEEEERELLKAAALGGQEERKRLIEGSLWRTMEYAKEFANQGLPMGDLIQEASVALALAVEDYEGGSFRDCLELRVRGALRDAVERQQEERKAEEEIAARVNVLKKVSEVMCEELGREATPKELADKMKMTVDEIKDIMKITLDAMSAGGE